MASTALLILHVYLTPSIYLNPYMSLSPFLGVHHSLLSKQVQLRTFERFFEQSRHWVE